MRTIHKMLLLHGGAPTYAQVIASLAPEIWRRFNETSGTTGINYGSLGSAQNSTWTPGTGSLGQNGQLGANEAYSFDKLTSKDQIPFASFINAPKFLTASLINPTDAGEGNFGTIWMVGSTNTRLLFDSTLGSLVFRRRSNAGAGDMLVDTDQGLTAGVWQWVFTYFDNTGDRKGYVYRGYQGAVTLLNKTTDTAATGTLVTESADLVIGNSQAQTTTFNGLYDEFIWKTGLTQSEAVSFMSSLTTSSGV